MGLIPGLETKIPHTMRCSQKINKNEKKKKNEALHTLTWKDLQEILLSEIMTNNGKVPNSIY